MSYAKISNQDVLIASDFFENEKHLDEFLANVTRYYCGKELTIKTKIVKKYFNTYKKTMDFIVNARGLGKKGGTQASSNKQLREDTLLGSLVGVLDAPLDTPSDQNNNSKVISNNSKVINKKLTKKEKYLLDFDSVIVEIVKNRPKIGDYITKWVDFKYDILKQPYKTIAWLTGLLKFSDQEIIDGINTAIEKEWNGIYPKKSTSKPFGQQQQQITYKTIKKTEEQLYYEKMREESLLAKNG